MGSYFCASFVCSNCKKSNVVEVWNDLRAENLKIIFLSLIPVKKTKKYIYIKQ